MRHIHCIIEQLAENRRFTYYQQLVTPAPSTVVTKKFRIEWFSLWSDLYNHSIGAVLMGIGGVLAMGCTIGQGVSGISTLALGSIIVFISIILGSTVTMKIQFYKIVYEDEATFLKTIITTMVDFHLLPNKLRKLNALHK